MPSGPWVDLSPGLDHSVVFLNTSHFTVKVPNLMVWVNLLLLLSTFSAVPRNSSNHSCYYHRMFLILPGQLKWN